MNFNIEEVERLIDHPDKQLYIAYLRKLQKSEKWLNFFTSQDYVDIWNKALAAGLPIDGDSVTITKRSSKQDDGNYLNIIVLTYDYIAYKNLVLLKYPETIFDHNVVYDGDIFSFRNDSGKITYSHQFSNPFNKREDAIIGAYAVIKNKRGEFIEFIDKPEVEKMRRVSKMDNVWKSWYERMVLKSVIKRICKVSFKDVVDKIDNIDNENDDLAKLDTPTLDDAVIADLKKAATFAEVMTVYKTYNGKVKNGNEFMKRLTEKKLTFEMSPLKDGWDSICESVAQGASSINDLCDKYYITGDNRQKIVDYAAKSI